MVDVEKIQSEDTLIIKVKGKLDTLSSPKFSNEIEEVFKNPCKNIILDFSTLEFISSSAMRTMLQLNLKARSSGSNVMLKGASQDILQIFSLTGLDKIFKLV